MVNIRALLAVVLHLAYLVAAFGWRTMVHRRRTGDSGFRWQRHDRVARVSGALFAAAIVAGTIGVTLAAFSVIELWEPLAATWAFVAGLVLFAAGCALTLAAQSAMGASWRIGVDPTERTGLVTSGLFGWVRNPIFTGMVTAAAGLGLLAPTVLTAVSVVILVIAVCVQVRHVEEPYLRDAMPGWSTYAQQVGRFVPRVGRIGR
ncbi:MAG: isoprenylcysteine carboxylmethyltransferase family protein [Ilumatobacteraceae bacterium]